MGSDPAAHSGTGGGGGKSAAGDRSPLLGGLGPLGEKDSASTFLMPRAARRLLDPATMVVIGARGSGKSALAQFLVSTSVTPSKSAYRLLQDQGVALRIWVDAFSQWGTRHPDAVVLDDFVRHA